MAILESAQTNKLLRTSGLRLMGYGLISILCLQTLIYMMTISGVIPLTGITLPFFSYGGSSLLSCMFITGMILGLSRKERVRMR